MVPATTKRLILNPAPASDEATRDQTHEGRARYAAAPPGALEQHLRELDREWDAEHVTAFTSGLALIGGVGLVFLLGEGWLVLPALIGLCLLLQGLVGWTPGLRLMRRLGFRTRRGIAHERWALQAMRGDFEAGGPVTAPREREALPRVEDAGWSAVTLADTPACDSAPDDARLRGKKR